MTRRALPCARADVARRHQPRPISGGSDDEGLRTPGRTRVVLVVDDHDDTRQMYVQFLESMGLRALEATTCAEAIAKSTEAELDAVVLDRRLPDGDGGAICHTLKSDPRTRAVPVVVLSGFTRDSTIQADAYLLKPVLPDVLLEELERLFARLDGG